MFEKTITDNKGVKWVVKFDFMRAGLIRDAIGFDIFAKGVGEKFEKGEFSPYDVAWFINSPRAKRLGITHDEFFDRFDTLDIIQASADALEAFFLSAAKDKKGKAQSGAAHGGVGEKSEDEQPSQELLTSAG